MEIQIITVAHRAPAWVDAGFLDYQQRFPKPYQIRLQTIAPKKTPQKESDAVLQAIPKDHYIIALDLKGALWDNQKLAEQLASWRQNHPKVSLLIGGADGLSAACLNAAHARWCLSPLIFPHALVRVIVIEQLWRAASMLANHPYHRS